MTGGSVATPDWPTPEMKVNNANALLPGWEGGKVLLLYDRCACWLILQRNPVFPFSLECLQCNPLFALLTKVFCFVPS